MRCRELSWGRAKGRKILSFEGKLLSRAGKVRDPLDQASPYCRIYVDASALIISLRI
jgi:hypothetical protein